jgi:hypothetical protein
MNALDTLRQIARAVNAPQAPPQAPAAPRASVPRETRTLSFGPVPVTVEITEKPGEWIGYVSVYGFKVDTLHYPRRLLDDEVQDYLRRRAAEHAARYVLRSENVTTAHTGLWAPLVQILSLYEAGDRWILPPMIHKATQAGPPMGLEARPLALWHAVQSVDEALTYEGLAKLLGTARAQEAALVRSQERAWEAMQYSRFAETGEAPISEGPATRAHGNEPVPSGPVSTSFDPLALGTPPSSRPRSSRGTPPSTRPRSSRRAAPGREVVRWLTDQAAIDALAPATQRALGGEGLDFFDARPELYEHNGRGYALVSLPFAGAKLAELRRILRDAGARGFDEEDRTSLYRFGRTSAPATLDHDPQIVTVASDREGRIVGLLAERAQHQIARYRSAGYTWMALDNPDPRALGLTRARLVDHDARSDAEPSASDRAWLAEHVPGRVPRADLDAFAQGLRERTAAVKQELEAHRRAYEDERAARRRSEERRADRQLRDLKIASYRLLVDELDRITDAFPELQGELLPFLRLTPRSKHEDPAEEHDEPSRDDLRRIVTRMHRAAAQIRKREERQRQSEREAEALRLVRAGADLKAGAPITYEHDDAKGYVWVKHTLHDGREQTAMIGWDEKGPYLFNGGKWRRQESERRPDGYLVRDR